MISRRFGTWIRNLRFEVKPLDERARLLPNGGEAQQFYLIKDMFTVRDRDWSGSDQMGGTEDWARDSYLQEWRLAFEHDEAGAYPHIYTRVETPQGLPIRNKSVFAWSDHHDRIYESDFQEYIDLAMETVGGWGRLELNNTSIFDPRLERGRWCIKPRGFSESVTGIGLPLASGISCFVVWVELPISEFTANGGVQRNLDRLDAELGSEFHRRIGELARVNQLIFFNPQATIQHKIIEDGFVPNSGEFEMEFKEARFVGQQAQHLTTGESRVYYVKRNQWHKVQWIPAEVT